MSSAHWALLPVKLDPVPERFAVMCTNVEESIRRIRHGEDPLELELLTQLNLDGIRLARLALLLRDEKTAKKNTQ